MAVIDDVLEAVESGEAVRLEAALSFHGYPCIDQEAEGAALCPAGVPPGSEVDVVSSTRCEGGFLTRDSDALNDTLARFFDDDGGPRPLEPRVYAIVEPLPGRIATPFPIVYMVIFASGHTLLLDEQGITHLGFPCGAVGATDLFHPADEALLEPPAS